MGHIPRYVRYVMLYYYYYSGFKRSTANMHNELLWLRHSVP